MFACLEVGLAVGTAKSAGESSFLVKVAEFLAVVAEDHDGVFGEV